MTNDNWLHGHFVVSGFFLFLILAAVACSQQKTVTETNQPDRPAVLASQQQAENELVIKYRSSWDYIHIQEGKITFVETQYHFAKPYLTIPDSVSQSVLLDEQIIAPNQLDSLAHYLVNSGFFDLDSTYGATEQDRYYLYSLEVRLDNLSHGVLYRSNPSFEEPPVVFIEVESFVKDFAKDQIK